MPVNMGVIARTILGLLFIFSGFVKGVDPIGTTYKIEDYLAAYGMPWFINFSTILSVGLNLVEFLTGIMLLFNIRIKFTTIIASLMMIFFTITTIFDATANIVPDCGCFGDAIKLSNWQTLYKNLTINLFLLVLWCTVKKIRPTFYTGGEVGIASFFGILFIAFQIYNLCYLPVIDFRDWKVGNKMTNDEVLPVEYWTVYTNNESYEDTTMLISDIPYNDSVWMSNWSFKDTKIIDKNVYPHNLMLIDEDGRDETAAVIGLPEPNLFIVSYSIEEMNLKHWDEIQNIIQYCSDNGYHVSFLTASEYDVYSQFVEEHPFDAVFYNADDIELKTMIRSNPGIVAMKDGVVLKKWHYNNVPEPADLEILFTK